MPHELKFNMEKKVSESKTTMTELVMPNDTNPLGNLMGGNLMRWMDIAASICAAKHCAAFVVTASVDHVSFTHPIKMGEVVTIEAQVTRAFNTSVEILVQVYSATMKGSNPKRSNHAYFTFVALSDETLKPQKVPSVIPLSKDEVEVYESASKRRELRLMLSGRISPQEANEIKAMFV